MASRTNPATPATTPPTICPVWDWRTAGATLAGESEGEGVFEGVGVGDVELDVCEGRP